MRDPMQKALDFAVAKEREAEAFYKEWSQKAEDPTVKALFSELAGIEHGHAEILSRITPQEASARVAGTSELGASELLVNVKASPKLTLQEAMIVAMKREEVAMRLYTRLSELKGEAKSLFVALAKEEARHKASLQDQYDEHILSDN